MLIILLVIFAVVEIAIHGMDFIGFLYVLKDREDEYEH